MRAIVSGAIAGIVVVVIAVAVALAVVPGIAPLAASPSPAPTIALVYPSVSPSPPSSPSPTPTASPVPTPTPSPTPTPPPCPTARPDASASPRPCPTPAPTATPAPTPSPTPIPGVGIAPGSPAPPLSVDLVGGGTFDLASVRGRPAWIVFTASWSPPGRTQLPLVVKYAAALGDRMAVIVVDVREDASTAGSFARAMKLTMPVGLDVNGQAQRAWAAYAFPINYWIDADGIVRAVAYGSVGSAAMQSNIRTLVPDASFAP